MTEEETHGRRETAGLMGLSAFAKAVHSIRTRYALVTGIFLLLFLGVFYVGGRFVLANLVQDTERQVRETGRRMLAMARRQADEIRTAAVAALARPGAAEANARALLSSDGAAAFSLVARFSSDGRFRDGVRRDARRESVRALAASDFADYADVMRDWSRVVRRTAKGEAAADGAVGLLQMDGKLHGVALLPQGDGFALFGLPFATTSFAGCGKEPGSNLEIRVCGADGAAVRQANARRAARSAAGIAPMFTGTLDDAPPGGSHWGFRASPMDATLVLRDISGQAVSVVSVSLPKVFLGATRMAVWQLAFFVALGGILFVLPIFWVQGRLLLNPLTRMTKAIAELGARAPGIDCPRIAWEGKDEFALLAESVNRLLETIAAKTVSLANVEASHQALIAGVPDALVVFDAQGRLASVSKQPEGVPQMPGLFAGEPPAAAVFGEAGVAAFGQAVAETLRTGAVTRVRLEAQRPLGASDDDPARRFELRLTRMSPRFALAIVRDVTAEYAEHLKRLAAEARAMDASKRESLTGFAAGLAHDMNNVLSVVLGAADAAAANPADDKMRTVEAIRDAVRRGTSMMRELRAFAGENRMSLVRANPKAVLEDVRQLASRVVGANTTVTFEEADGLPDVDVDFAQFWKVVFNVVKNAGEAIGTAPGHVTIGVAPFRMTHAAAADFASERPLPEGEGVVFRIADDGPGIPEEIRRRIFDPYVSSKSLGRGLGLATVRTIVEAHGGGIAVESRPGLGTTFRIFLPVSRLPAETGPAAASGDAAKPAAAAGAGLSGDVLLVDDDEAILRTTKILCKAMGIEAHVAHDRHEAMAFVRRRADGLKAIVLDAHLGQFDTVRLLGAFRLGAPNVPVILSSGASPEAMERMFRAHPYDVFLQKPYTLDELRRAFAQAAAAV